MVGHLYSSHLHSQIPWSFFVYNSMLTSDQGWILWIIIGFYHQKTTSSWNNRSINSSCWPAQEVRWCLLTCCFLRPQILPCWSCLLVKIRFSRFFFPASPQTPHQQNTHTFQYQIAKDGTISFCLWLSTKDMREGPGDALHTKECHSCVRSTSHIHTAGLRYFWAQFKNKFENPVYM